MILKKETSYSPVQWIYREIILEEIEKGTSGKIFFFCDEQQICTANGRILCIKDIPQRGLFIEIDTHYLVRIDRIITLFGKPGAAYDEYDSYANACLDCMGGYEYDDL